MEPQNKQCPAPTNVNISGTLIIYGGAAAFAKFSGTLTDVSSGRSYSFTTQIGVGGGFAAGSYNVSGTVPGFASLDRGFGIAFATGGYGGLGYGVSKIHSLGGNGGTIGVVDVNAGIFALPAGAADVGFKNGASRTLTNAGRGC